MKAFSELIHRLYFTTSNSAKASIFKGYLQSSVDPDRGWAVAALSGTLDLSLFKRKLVKIKLSANESALGPSPKAIEA